MKALYIVLIAVLLAGCGPSAEQITATAVMAQAQTETAAPTFTPTATFTSTPTQTPTSTLTPTNTPTPTPSSTATPAVTSTATSKPSKSRGGLPGKSLANSVLQKDVLKLVLIFESGFGCNNSKVVNTIIVDPLAQGKWSERWIMDRCGTEGSYLITFNLAPTGGVDFVLNIEK